MPFNELQRRDSWPPTVVRLQNDEEDADGFVDLSAIDEDPFSFFLASPEDPEDSIDADEDLSAGIETSSSKPTIREVSPSSLQRVPVPDDDDDDDDYALEMPLTLRAFTLRHTSGKKSRTGHYEPPVTGLGISIPEDVALRGRPRARLSSPRSGSGRGAGRTRARSLSARRPQSWRLPSPEIWSIIEEEREDDAGMEPPSSGKQEPAHVLPSIHITEPTPTEEPAEEVSSPSKKKKKKRVHWAL